MKHTLLIITFSVLFFNCNNAQVENSTTNLTNKKIIKLNLIKNNPIKQLELPDNERFDLSGIVFNGKDIFVNADKKWNNKIYRIDTTSNSFKIISEIKLCPKSKIDFEGVEFFNNNFYLIEEWENNVFKIDPTDCKLEKLKINWKNLNINDDDWGNKGLEGLAIDCKNEVLYLAKERQPRRIFKINLNNNEISEPFKDILTIQKQGYDISDMKFENDFLYILERGRGLVTKINTTTKETKSLSFNHIVFKNGQRIYTNKNQEYGMAEALLLTKTQIWIGLDNNGDYISEYGKSLGLKHNNKPIILIFERPDDF